MNCGDPKDSKPKFAWDFISRIFETTAFEQHRLSFQVGSKTPSNREATIVPSLDPLSAFLDEEKNNQVKNKPGMSRTHFFTRSALVFTPEQIMLPTSTTFPETRMFVGKF
jgi:hypothetical protein